MQNINIITLIDGIHKGDDANAIATTSETKKLLDNKGYAVTSNITNTTSSAVNDNIDIIIAAGNHHIEPLLESKQKNNNIYTSWSSHQLPINLPQAAEVIDNIALPKHIIDDNLKLVISLQHANLTETVGVAHNTMAKDLIPEYHKLKNQIINSDKYNLVVLAGDATDQYGQMQYYTPEESFKLGEYFGKNSQNDGSVVIATNGPRTGKHNPKTGEVTLSHRNVSPETKEALPNILDPVSQAFLDGLNSVGLVKDKHYNFFDFRFGKDGVISAYKGLLGATISNEGSSVYMPGESSSMISEACDLLPDGAVIIYDNDAMSESHQKHVKSVYEQGSAHRLSGDLHLSKKISGKNNTTGKNMSAAQVVAQSIADNFKAISEKVNQGQWVESVNKKDDIKPPQR